MPFVRCNGSTHLHVLHRTLAEDPVTHPEVGQLWVYKSRDLKIQLGESVFLVTRIVTRPYEAELLTILDFAYEPGTMCRFNLSAPSWHPLTEI